MGPCVRPNWELKCYMCAYVREPYATGWTFVLHQPLSCERLPLMYSWPLAWDVIWSTQDLRRVLYGNPLRLWPKIISQYCVFVHQHSARWLKERSCFQGQVPRPLNRLIFRAVWHGICAPKFKEASLKNVQKRRSMEERLSRSLLLRMTQKKMSFSQVLSRYMHSLR